MQNSKAAEQDLRIIILGKTGSHVRADRKCLRSVLRQEPEIFASGVEAAVRLRDAPETLVICDGELEDMTGLDFVRLVRLHPDMQQTPLLLISVDNRREAVLSALAAGCTRYLLRPYSLLAFSRVVMAVLKAQPGTSPVETQMPEPSAQAFERALEGWRLPPEPLPDPFDEAMASAQRLLSVRQYKEAREHFRTALKLAPGNAEALYGLAHCWVALGHPAQARESLREAAEAYLQKGDYRRARKVYEELQKRDPGAKDPLSSSLETLLRRGDVEGAAELLKSAHERGDVPLDISQSISRACHFTPDPQSIAGELCDALDLKGATAPATALRVKLLESVRHTRKAADGTLVEEREEAPVTAWGSLRTVYEVAKYTLQAYRRDTQPERA